MIPAAPTTSDSRPTASASWRLHAAALRPYAAATSSAYVVLVTGIPFWARPLVTWPTTAGSRVSRYAAIVAEPRPRQPWASRFSILMRLADGGPPGANGRLPPEVSN